MVRYKAVIAYDGTDYAGFQTQPNARTIQADFEATLKKINSNTATPIFASGRTDAGVHAVGQVLHFDLAQRRDVEKLRHALDTQTPASIAVRSVEVVADDFHARYHACEKTYHYRLDIGKPRNPFRRRYAAYFPYPLDIEKMEEAIRSFIGTHDFSAFCATGSAVEDKVRTIYEARIERHGEELLFVFRGDGFLYKMVRIMVGTLLKIGAGKLAVDSIPTIIASRDREQAPFIAHPEGLYLMQVNYQKTKENE